MVVSMIPHHRPHPPVRQVALSHALIWMLVLSFILPPSLLAQNLPPQVAPPGMMQQASPGTPGSLFTRRLQRCRGRGRLRGGHRHQPHRIAADCADPNSLSDSSLLRSQFEGNGSQLE